MKCYNHHDRDAFGVCKSCGKALCLECIDNIENTVCCKNNEKCKEFIKNAATAINDYKKQQNSKKIMSIVFLLASIIGIIMGIKNNSFAVVLVAIFFMALSLIMMTDKKV